MLPEEGVDDLGALEWGVLGEDPCANKMTQKVSSLVSLCHGQSSARPPTRDNTAFSHTLCLLQSHCSWPTPVVYMVKVRSNLSPDLPYLA